MSSAPAVRGLRRLATPRPAAGPPVERCDFCGNEIPADHRHLLQLDERYIVCTCEPCWALRSGDREFRPTGTRREVLDGFVLTDELWAEFRIPVGLAFFFVNGAEGKVLALYPSPAGATESELDLGAWSELAAANPGAVELEPDIEGLIVSRVTTPHRFAVAPIDDCYRLVGMIKASWQGISGGDAVEQSVTRFFAGLGAAP